MAFRSIQKSETRSFFTTYIGNTDRVPILATYRTFLSSWSSLTGNEIPALKTLTEIYDKPKIFNTKSDGVNNLSMILNKSRSAWAIFYCDKRYLHCNTTRFYNRFIKSRTAWKHIHNPGYQDYLEILKFILKDIGKTRLNKILPFPNRIPLT